MLKTFIASCMDLIDEARAQGATLREVYEIVAGSGCPITWSTFQSYYYELRVK